MTRSPNGPLRVGIGGLSGPARCEARDDRLALALADSPSSSSAHWRFGCIVAASIGTVTTRQRAVG